MKRETQQEPRVIQEAREHLEATKKKSLPGSELLNTEIVMTRRRLIASGIVVAFIAAGSEDFLKQESSARNEFILGREPTKYFDGILKFHYENLRIFDESGEEYPHESIIGINNLSKIKNGKYLITDPLLAEYPPHESEDAIRLNLRTSIGHRKNAVGYAPLSQIRFLNLGELNNGTFRPIGVDGSGHLIEGDKRVSKVREAGFGKIEIAIDPVEHPDNTEIV